MLSLPLSLVALVLGLRTLYQIPWIRFYAKFAIFCGVINLVSLYYVVEFSFRGRDFKNIWRFKRFLRLAGYLIGIRPVVKDAHYLTFDRPCVYVANHQSCIDAASLVDVWPENCTIIVKSSLRFAGPIGILTWLSKLIYIVRSKHKDAICIMKHTADVALKHKVSVYVFPEGTRTCTGTLLPFKKGAFHLAIECQFPIQPIVISSYTNFLNFKQKRFDDASYYVQVLPQISTKGLNESNVDALLTETREKMLECLENLKKIPPPR